MAFRHVPSHPGSPWQHSIGPAIGVILLALLVGFTLYIQQSRYSVSLPVESPVVAPAAVPLDQHERHPELVMPAAVPLDQHERHPALIMPAAPLDQHERHPALSMPAAPRDQHERHLELGMPAAAPLDQHERHPSTN